MATFSFLPLCLPRKEGRRANTPFPISFLISAVCRDNMTISNARERLRKEERRKEGDERGRRGRDDCRLISSSTRFPRKLCIFAAAALFHSWTPIRRRGQSYSLMQRISQMAATLNSCLSFFTCGGASRSRCDVFIFPQQVPNVGQ